MDTRTMYISSYDTGHDADWCGFWKLEDAKEDFADTVALFRDENIAGTVQLHETEVPVTAIDDEDWVDHELWDWWDGPSKTAKLLQEEKVGKWA